MKMIWILLAAALLAGTSCRTYRSSSTESVPIAFDHIPQVLQARFVSDYPHALLTGVTTFQMTTYDDAYVFDSYDFTFLWDAEEEHTRAYMMYGTNIFLPNEDFRIPNKTLQATRD